MGEKIKEEENHPAKDGFPDSFVAEDQFNQWMSERNILNERYLKALERDNEFWEGAVGLQAIILYEQPNLGRTIIEKIEANSDVQYAVILYTPCEL